MNCPHCSSPDTKRLARATVLGYQIFHCRHCQRKFNERTGTPFNFLEYPTDIVLLVVLWRLRYRLSLRNLAEMFLERGFQFTHEAVREWEERFVPLITGKLRARRRRQAGTSWYVDETYIKAGGHWCYLYRAIDRDGNLVDCMLSRKRDRETARSFFKGAVEVVGHKPDRVTTDGYDVYPRAVAEELGEEVCHRTNRYLNNRLEQDHRGIKQRYYCMQGFKCFQAASQFCQAFDELRNYLRPRQRMKQAISLAAQRRVHLERMENLKGMLQTA